MIAQRLLLVIAVALQHWCLCCCLAFNLDQKTTILLPHHHRLTEEKYRSSSLRPQPPTSSSRLWASIPGSSNDDGKKRTDPNKDDIVNDLYYKMNKKLGRRQDKHILESRSFILTPIISGILSFYLYPTTALWFHNCVAFLSNNKFESVDGGQLQWSILLPALNGVVMMAVSLLYANMISTTGTQLRQRQMNIHTSLSQEMEGIRALLQLIPYYPISFRYYFNEKTKMYFQKLVKEVS